MAKADKNLRIVSINSPMGMHDEGLAVAVTMKWAGLLRPKQFADQGC